MRVRVGDDPTLTPELRLNSAPTLDPRLNCGPDTKRRACGPEEELLSLSESVEFFFSVSESDEDFFLKIRKNKMYLVKTR